MEFNNSFTVQKPLEEVWGTMTDLERVIPAVPDASILEKTGDDAVKAEVKIKLGSMSMNYSGPAEIVEKDDAAHRAVMTAQAKEAGGQGNADARVTMELSEQGDGTEVSLHSVDQRHRQGGSDGRRGDRRGDRGHDQGVLGEPRGALSGPAQRGGLGSDVISARIGFMGVAPWE